MRKKLIYLALLATTFGGSQSYGADAALNYLKSSGTPPSLAPKNCSSACNDNACKADIGAKTYRCFRGCAQHTGIAQLMKCVNTQFTAFIGDLHAQINALMQQNAAQGQQLAGLQAQLAQAQQKMQDRKMKLGAGAAQNAQLQQKLEQAAQNLQAVLDVNNQLNQQLAAANANINQQAADINGLKAQVAANEQNIAGLKGEIDDLGRVLTQIMADYGEIVGKYAQLGNFINTTADKVREADDRMQAVAREFAAALSQDQAAIDQWVAANQQRLQQVQDDYARRVTEYQNFIRDALTVLREHKADTEAEINRLINDYNR